MKYNEALQFLYSQLPMYQRIGKKAFKKDLKNIHELTKPFGEPHIQYPSIHIAGTNGKGTVAHLLAAVLQSAGYKTGLYTSPHYKDFRERIKLNGRLIPKRRVAAFVTHVRKMLPALRPSFFEISVAMAFHYFAEEHVDIAIIETGLGGRLDSTNVVNPLLSVITNISLDHQEMLGSTLEEIAIEKAGIIKQGKPVLIGAKNNSVDQVFVRRAKQMKSRLYFAQDISSTEMIYDHVHSSTYLIKFKEKKLDDRIDTNLNGPWQAENINTAISTIWVLKEHYPEFIITQTHIAEGIKNVCKRTSYQGRWQVISKEPLIIADSAHNEVGLKSTIQRLKEIEFGKMHMVIGFTKEKDLNVILSHFPVSAKYYFCKANVPRGLNANQLRSNASKFGLIGKSYSSVRHALSAAKKCASPEDLIFVGGSTFIVAEVI